MGGSLIINVLVYTHNIHSPVTYSIGLKSNICDSHNNTSDCLSVFNAWVCTTGG